MKANQAWIKLIGDISLHGTHVSNGTLELISNQSIIDMNYPIVTIPERKLNYKFMFGEAEWILSGSNNVKHISKYMKAISKFSDNGITFRGAYGPKIVDQLDYVVCSLLTNPASRQAVLNIWRENPRDTKDYPCTLNMQWIIRNGKLNCITNMRSSDVWLGWVYDVFNFSMISNYILIMLKKELHHLKLGNLYLTAASQHIYDRDAGDISSVLNYYTDDGSGKLDSSGLEDPDVFIEYLGFIAGSIQSSSTFDQFSEVICGNSKCKYNIENQKI